MNDLLEAWKARWNAFKAVVIAPMGLRSLLLLAIAAFFLSHDWQLARAMGFSLGLVVAILAVVHWARKVMYPYLDLAKFVERAHDDPVAAAYVVLGVLASGLGVAVLIVFVAIR